MTTRTKRSAKSSRIEALVGDARALLKGRLKESLPEVLEAEMTEAVGAGPGERTTDRVGYRSGYDSRGVVTRTGKVEFWVPRDREGRFSTERCDRFHRSETALVSAFAEMYVQGVSTRTGKAVTDERCGRTLSASTGSRINQSLDGLLRRCARRRREEAYPDDVILEARDEQGRLDGVIQSPAVFMARGINAEGRRQVRGGGAVEPGVTIELDDVCDGCEDAGPARGATCDPKRTDWVDAHIGETLNVSSLPRHHHKHLKSTNMRERRNEEITRRPRVVRIFPTAARCLRLVRALWAETHEGWLEDHRYVNMEVLKEQKKELRTAA